MDKTTSHQDKITKMQDCYPRGVKNNPRRWEKIQTYHQKERNIKVRQLVRQLVFFYIYVSVLMNFFILRDGIIIRVSGVKVPPPLPKNFNEIYQIYRSHLIYGESRIRFNMLICQSVCDQCATSVFSNSECYCKY